MKRRGNLFSGISSVESLYRGYEAARKNKRSKRSCFVFERRLAANIETLHTELVSGAYRPQPYNRFRIKDPKERLICAPAFRDRVVQHAVYEAVRPILDRSFIDQSFACRLGKGTHSSSDYVQWALNQAPKSSYFLQMDIRKYYYRMDREILLSILSNKIKDKKVLDLFRLFADNGEVLGIPTGCLLSQLDGLCYLNPLDHFIKRELKVSYYARYVDDFVLIGLTLEEAELAEERIAKFLKDRLSLELSKSNIIRVSKGINFVGFRTWASRRFVRKRALYTFRRAAKKGKTESVVSSIAHASKTASKQHMIRYLQEHHSELYRQLPKKVRRLHRIPTKCSRELDRTMYYQWVNLRVDT